MMGARDFRQFNDFSDWLEDHNLSTYAVAMYFLILTELNRAYWKQPVMIELELLMTKLGVTKRASFYARRQELIDAGLIAIRSGRGNDKTRYWIKIFTPNSAENSAENPVDNSVDKSVDNLQQSGTNGYTPSGTNGYTPSGTNGYTPSGTNGHTPSGTNGYTPSGTNGTHTTEFLPIYNKNNINNKTFIKGEKKQKFAEKVLLSITEFEELKNKAGSELAVREWIEMLDHYKKAHGKEYESDYDAICSWVIRQWKNDHPEIGARNDIVAAAEELERRQGGNDDKDTDAGADVWGIWTGK